MRERNKHRGRKGALTGVLGGTLWRASPATGGASAAAYKEPAVPVHFCRVRSRWRRPGRVAIAMPAPPYPKEQGKNQGRASTRNVGADLSKHFFSCLGNKSSAREPPFGVQAGIRKDKPEGNGAASRTKGGSRARCARDSGSQLSSPVRAEEVLSFTKPLQRLVCRGFGVPSVGLQAGSVCRGQSQWCIKKTPCWGVVEELGEEHWNILNCESERGASLFLIPAKPDKEVGEEC